MDHGHANEDLGVVLLFLLFPDIERSESSFAPLEGSNLLGCSFANGCNLSRSRVFDGFLLC